MCICLLSGEIIEHVVLLENPEPTILTTVLTNKYVYCSGIELIEGKWE